jgi:general secretion pathway protein D
VILDISQEVSDVTKTSTSNIDSPTIQQRRIASSVAVNSGEMIALGGLIKDRNEKDNTGIPLLSSIPVVGNLFKTTGNTTDRTELLVLLSPRVIKDSAASRLATEELRQQMKGLAILEQHSPPVASNTP